MERIKEELKKLIANDSNIDEYDILYFKQGIIDDYVAQFNEVIKEVITELEMEIDE